MTLTISELARAVGKSDNYVRQHIRRNHLIAQRQDRSVSVAVDEAARWAHDRGLPFNPPAQAVSLMGSSKSRTARMTVLMATHSDDSTAHNMFTLIRHRREDSLGPWTTAPAGTWGRTELGHGLRLYTLDSSLDRCSFLIEQILNSGALTIDGVEVLYVLEPVPRRHWAYRDLRSTDASVRSPFSRNSAEITEYWSFDQSLRKRWTEIAQALSGKQRQPTSRLGFPLEERSERVGNLMIAGALDALTCNLTHHRQMLKLDVQGDDLVTALHRAVVWASHSEDTVLRREVPVTSTSIKLASDVDHIGFSIYRTEDGQCVDHLHSHLIKEFRVRVNIADQPMITIRNQKTQSIQKVIPSGTTVPISANDDRFSADLDRRIRKDWLERQVYQREVSARKTGNLARFAPENFDASARYLLGLLHIFDAAGPVYLADPYFMEHTEGDAVASLIVQIFAATRNRPLRILCGKVNKDRIPAWWSKYPNVIAAHVRVRAFFDCRGKPPFHDRYLITPESETVITNSLSGWHRSGVTFIRVPFGVYRAETEKMWTTEIGAPGDALRVKVIS